MTGLKTDKKSVHGGAMLEFVLCFPILFVIFLFIVQFAQILLSWQVVHYAAFMGARSTLVCNSSEQSDMAKDAVLRILSVVSNSPEKSSGKGGKYDKLDGWGVLPLTKYVEDQTDVSIDSADSDKVKCTVKFKMFLMVPVAGKIISYFADETSSGGANDALKRELEDQGVALNPALLATHSNELDSTGIPYIEITSYSVVAHPYDTKIYPKQ